MRSKQNEKQNIEIAEIRKDVCYLKKEVLEIKIQVFNHLPSKINDVSQEIQNFKLSNVKWMISILVSLVFILVGVLANLFR